MSVAIDLFGAVYTTQGGTRYHADPACYALANGRSTQAYRAGEGAYGESWYGAGSLDGLYPLERRSVISAVRFSYTACLRCVPAANALPFPIGETYGHERLTINPSCCGDSCCGNREERQVCVRCSNDISRRHGWNWALDVPWPCTSAVVLGLVPRGGA
jgi:hypothetical protein